MGEQVRLAVLGPLCVEIGGEEVAITSERNRVLLAMLLLHANKTVPVSQLIDAIWGDEPPRNARNQLQGCVSRLRRQLGAGDRSRLLVTEVDGYRVRVEPSALDLMEYHQLRDGARSAADHVQAAQRYRAALALWRGPALIGIDSVMVRQSAAALNEE